MSQSLSLQTGVVKDESVPVTTPKQTGVVKDESVPVTTQT